jgi:hypothetical protein
MKKLCVILSLVSILFCGCGPDNQVDQGSPIELECPEWSWLEFEVNDWHFRYDVSLPEVQETICHQVSEELDGCAEIEDFIDNEYGVYEWLCELQTMECWGEE